MPETYRFIVELQGDVLRHRLVEQACVDVFTIPVVQVRRDITHSTCMHARVGPHLLMVGAYGMLRACSHCCCNLYM